MQQGHQVVLYEAGPAMGGLVRTFEIGGGRIECYYHHIFHTDTVIQRLIHELGFGDRLVWRDSTVGVYYQGRIYNFVTPLDLLRFTPVPFIDRIRLGLVGLYLRRKKEWAQYEKITAKEWIIKYAGRRNYDVVWGPLLRGKFGEAADELSMAWFWSKIHLRFASRHGGPLQKEQLGYLMGSFGVYIDEMERRLRAGGAELHTARPVAQILAEGGKAVGLRLADGETIACDAVVAALPLELFAKIAPPLTPDYQRRLRAVRWQSAMCLVLALKHPISHVYWMNICDRDVPFLALVEHTNFIEPTYYGGHHVVYLSNYLEPGSPLLKMDIDELCDLYLPYLSRINPAFSPDWVEGRWLFKAPNAQPIITCNYSQDMPDHRTPVRGLYLANMTQIYPEDRGQNYSIRMGEQVAAMVEADAQSFIGVAT